MVRYADHPRVEVDIDVAAGPTAVWGLVTDINLPARFSSEFKGADWLDGAPGLRVGATFRGRNAHDAIGAWETSCTVVACEPERVFAWEVQGPGGEPSAEWGFSIEPTADGCRVTQWARMGPGPSGLTPAIERMPDKEERIVGRRLDEWRTNMTANLEGIKALAEAV